MKAMKLYFVFVFMFAAGCASLSDLSFIVDNEMGFGSGTPTNYNTNTVTNEVTNLRTFNARDVFVSSSKGYDTNEGTIESPLKTIRAAIEMVMLMTNGSGTNVSINVMSGFYNEHLYMTNTGCFNVLAGWNSTFSEIISSAYLSSLYISNSSNLLIAHCLMDQENEAGTKVYFSSGISLVSNEFLSGSIGVDVRGSTGVLIDYTEVSEAGIGIQFWATSYSAISNSSITYCVTNGIDGAGLRLYNATGNTVVNTEVSYNETSDNAAGVYVYGNDNRFIGLTIDNNTAFDASAFYGYGSGLALADCEIKNNTANQSTVVIMPGTSNTVTNCLLRLNTGDRIMDHNGGLYTRIHRTTFQDNTADVEVLNLSNTLYSEVKYVSFMDNSGSTLPLSIALDGFQRELAIVGNIFYGTNNAITEKYANTSNQLLIGNRFTIGSRYYYDYVNGASTALSNVNSAAFTGASAAVLNTETSN